MYFLFNKLNLPIFILSLLIPLTALLSHSVGHDEWLYYKTINYTQVESILSLIEPHNSILGFKTPRYLLAYPIFDILNKLTLLPLFWIHYLILIPPTLIIINWLRNNGLNSFHSFLLVLALAFFLTHPNFYNTGILFLIASLHSNNFMKFLLFSFGCSLHPIPFVNGLLLIITPYFKKRRLISITILLLILLISIFYSHNIYEKNNEQKFVEEHIIELEEEKKIENRTIAQQKLFDLKINKTLEQKIYENKQEVIEEKIISMPKYEKKILPKYKIQKDRGFIPLFFARDRMNSGKIISIIKDRSMFLWMIILSFIFFRNIKTKFAKFIIIIPIILFLHSAAISALGQIKNGGPGIFLIKSFFIDNASNYIWFGKDQLLWKALYNKNVNKITLGSKTCLEKNKELMALSSPFTSIENFKPFKEKVGENCLPQYFENSDISFYGIKYRKDSITEKCIDTYLPLSTELWGSGKLDPTEIHAFFKITTLPNGEYFITGSNKGSDNTNISDISHMSMYVANCIIKNKN